MAKKDVKITFDPIKEAARLLRENPNWTHKQALDKAKEQN